MGNRHGGFFKLFLALRYISVYLSIFLLMFAPAFSIVLFKKGGADMTSVVSAITKTVPISQFNRGLAGQIFSDVKSHGPKVVMKNNAAEVVLMPPAEYVEIMDALNDYLLLTMAIERMANYDSSSLISEEEMDKRLGITQEELDSIGEVEFE